MTDQQTEPIEPSAEDIETAENVHNLVNDAWGLRARCADLRGVDAVFVITEQAYEVLGRVAPEVNGAPVLGVNEAGQATLAGLPLGTTNNHSVGLAPVGAWGVVFLLRPAPTS